MAKAKAKPSIEIEQPDTIEGCGDVIWRALQYTAYREDIGDDKKPNAQAIERKKRELLDLQALCQERVTMMLAKTPQDACIQLAMLGGEIDLVEADGMTEHELRRVHRKITRMLFSLMRWIEAEHGVARHRVCEHYLNSDCDPWSVAN